MNTNSIEDLKIYEMAAEILNSIAQDINDELYSKELGGSLSFSWSTEHRVTAWAESEGDPTIPPNHQIVISYELARQVYRDIEGYYEFAISTLLEEPATKFLQHLDPKPQLPEHTDKNAVIRNMYIGAITWVFFHELGHLAQEHGYIRSIFGDGNPKIRVEDCESCGEQIVEGRDAVISHVTELAADIHATYTCVSELARHFLPDEESIDSDSQKEFRDNLYLMVCGMSCLFYRLHGEILAEPPEEEPKGSHPTAIRRLETCIPNIFEKLDYGGHGQKLHGMSRKELVHLCIGAAEGVGFYWLWPYVNPITVKNFLIRGVLQDPHITSYWKNIVLTWDEMKPEIEKVKRFGNELTMLSFTDELRAEIFTEQLME